MRRWGGVRDDLEGYVRRTLYHLAVDQWRSRARRPTAVPLEFEPQVADDAAGVALRHALVQALARLRVVSAIGAVGVVGTVTAAVVMHGPLIDASQTPPGAPRQAEVRLDAQTVAARISQALTDVERMVIHVDLTTSYGDRTSIRHELWIDPVTGDHLSSGRYDRGVDDTDTPQGVFRGSGPTVRHPGGTSRRSRRRT